MSVKRTGVMNDREIYKVTIRKNTASEDYKEMVAIQENSIGKKRFMIRFEDFKENDIHEFIDFMRFDNYYRNAFIRKSIFITCAVVR